MSMPNLALVEWKKDVLETAADRFERRLSEELGATRIEVVREFASVRSDIAGLRVDMTRMQSSLLRWMFVFWIGQFAVMLTLVGLLLPRP